jgi:CubicO group peptidase (beta-lactamase class C family)
MLKGFVTAVVALLLAISLAFISFTFPVPQFPPGEPNSILRELKAAGTSGGLVISGISPLRGTWFWGYKNFEAKEQTSPQHVFNLGSVSKQFTGFVLMQMENEEKIHHTDPIQSFLPELRGSELGRATVGDLARMKSGLPYIESQVLKLISQLQNRNWSQEEIIQEISKQKLLFRPGERFEYSNLGYSLLGVIVSRIEKKPLSVTLKERIFDPFQMRNTYLDYPELANTNRAKAYFQAFGRLIPMPNWNSSFLQGAGGIVSNVSDLEKWIGGLIKFLNANPKSKDALFKREDNTTYDYGWDLSREGIIRHSGETPGFCSYIAVSENGTMVAYTINTDIILRDNRSIHLAIDKAVSPVQ